MRGVVAALLALTLGSPTVQDKPQSTNPPARKVDVAGAWTLNRELTTMPPQDEMQRPGGGRGGNGGGFGGFGGGGRGGFGGMGGGTGKPSDEQMRKMQVLRRRLTEVPDRLIVVRDPQAVSITDGNGRRMNYKLDGKKQDQFTGDGEFTSKTHFDGDRLIVEEDFDGRKITTTYAPILDGEILRLEVTVKPEGGRSPDGGRGGRSGASGDLPPRPAREFKRVYDLEARGQAGYFFF